MTKDEFQQLSPEKQEEFINSGGTISSPVDVVCNSYDSVAGLPSTVKEQVESAVGSSSPLAAQDGVIPSSSTQPASILTDSFNILNPVELLFLLDDDIMSGVTKLHPWQVQFMIDFANEAHTKDQPFNAEV